MPLRLSYMPICLTRTLYFFINSQEDSWDQLISQVQVEYLVNPITMGGHKGPPGPLPSRNGRLNQSKGPQCRELLALSGQGIDRHGNWIPVLGQFSVLILSDGPKSSLWTRFWFTERTDQGYAEISMGVLFLFGTLMVTSGHLYWDNCCQSELGPSRISA